MTNFNTPVSISNFRAGADLSTTSNLYKAVKLDSNGEIILAVANDPALGFLANSPLLGEATEIWTEGGGAKGIAAEAITSGDLLKSDANGDLVIANTTGDWAIARAMNSAVTSDIFEIQPILAQLV